MKSGRGTLTFPDGKSYSGDWAKDRPRGPGTQRYPDGMEYVGEWRDGEPSGQGVMT
jgi:hypothetical protein